MTSRYGKQGVHSWTDAAGVLRVAGARSNKIKNDKALICVRNIKYFIIFDG